MLSGQYALTAVPEARGSPTVQLCMRIFPQRETEKIEELKQEEVRAKPHNHSKPLQSAANKWKMKIEKPKMEAPPKLAKTAAPKTSSDNVAKKWLARTKKQAPVPAGQQRWASTKAKTMAINRLRATSNVPSSTVAPTTTNGNQENSEKKSLTSLKNPSVVSNKSVPGTSLASKPIARQPTSLGSSKPPMTTRQPPGSKPLGGKPLTTRQPPSSSGGAKANWQKAATKSKTVNSFGKGPGVGAKKPYVPYKPPAKSAGGMGKGGLGGGKNGKGGGPAGKMGGAKIYRLPLFA
eukprot:sb/3467574/